MNKPPNPAFTNTTNNTIIPPPLPASQLLDSEIARRETLASKGRIQTGCHGIDEHVLLGGFDRGSVVGVSVEEEGVGLAVSSYFIFLSWVFIIPFSLFCFVLFWRWWVGLVWVGLWCGLVWSGLVSLGSGRCWFGLVWLGSGRCWFGLVWYVMC
jgi:hypothetical protein